MPINRLHYVPDDDILDLEDAVASKNVQLIYNLYRYWWAWAIIRHVFGESAVIWDMGCGDGHGCRILNAGCRHVIHGFDFDDEALHAARTKHDNPSTTWHSMDLDGPWFQTPSTRAFGVAESFKPDVIVCFETLEFLRNRDMFLLRCSRMLKKDGVLMLSMPFADETQTDYKPAWAAHRLLYSRRDAVQMCRGFFGFVTETNDAGFPGKSFKQDIDKRMPDGLTVGNNIIYASKPRGTS